MTASTRDVLARHFGHATGALKRGGKPSAAELELARREGYDPDATLSLSHDEVVERTIAAAARLTPEGVARAFVCGVGGSWLRGRQSLISYAYARYMTAHRADPTPGYDDCRTCGIPLEADIELADEVVRWHLGSVWNEGVQTFFVDLEELAAQSIPEPTEADRATLKRLLEVAAEADPAETPSQLEQRLAKLKVVPDSDKYKRYGILEALAEIGVLPNRVMDPSWDRFVTQQERWDASKHVRGPARSDIVVPFGAWRGADGVDAARAKTILGVVSA